MNTDTINLIDVTAIYPHPSNPRIEPRQDIIEQLAERMANGFDPSHAMIVRPINGGYQIISGHHRLLAAERAGLADVPCWVREMSDEEAYMQLVLCNTQSELHPLEEGKHAAESGMDLKAYAEAAGKNEKTLHTKLRSWRVLANLHVEISQIRDSWRNLAEIHAAPQWLWPALVAKMIEGEWTVATTRQMVGNYKTADQPPAWCDAEAIAKSLLSGQLSIPDLGKLYSYPDRVNVIDDDLRKAMWDDLRAARPSRLSDIQAIAHAHESEQAERLAERRKAEAESQRQQEEARQRVARLRKNCSLDEWKDLNEAEREMLQAPIAGEGGTFNQQKGDSIEWAQWSWNPVTGCKHDCPYCYARDIALGERMQQSSLYPNGWEPTFRSLSLNAPKNTKVPKDAATDTRYRNVFTCSMADLFGRWVPIEWINSVMLAVHGNPQWNFLFLTKFPQRFSEIEIPENAWMGTTVDMQARVKNAEKAFANLTSGVRWLSVEPMIEPITLTRPDLFNWVVIGGASASKQTPAWQPPYRWVESLVRQCDEAGVPVYMKSNLGIANRVLQLPFDAPVKSDPQRAPDAFHYLAQSA